VAAPDVAVGGLLPIQPNAVGIAPYRPTYDRLRVPVHRTRSRTAFWCSTSCSFNISISHGLTKKYAGKTLDLGPTYRGRRYKLARFLLSKSYHDHLIVSKGQPAMPSWL